MPCLSRRLLSVAGQDGAADPGGLTDVGESSAASRIGSKDVVIQEVRVAGLSESLGLASRYCSM
jgi:hypothetical protein